MDTHKKYCDEIINAQAGVMPGLDKLKEAIKETKMALDEPIQIVLRRHVVSCTLMKETYERVGTSLEVAHSQGMIDGLERAIEVADNRQILVLNA